MLAICCIVTIFRHAQFCMFYILIICIFNLSMNICGNNGIFSHTPLISGLLWEMKYYFKLIQDASNQ